MSESEVVTINPLPEPAIQSETGAIISMIERAARDPNVDIDKLERLFQMRERMEASRARMSFDAAFAAMQPELPEIDKRGKIVIRDKHDRETVLQSTPYALWDDTNKVIKPILAKHGFGLSFRISQTEGRLTTTAVLSHTSGHREETSFASPIDNTGSKNNVQGWGSAFSYGKRYTGTALLNISTKGEDDDGKTAGAGETISEAQYKELSDLIKATGTDVVKFLELGNVPSLSDIPAANFAKAKALLIAKKNKKMVKL